MLRVGGKPRKTTTVYGTVPLKPLYKGAGWECQGRLPLLVALLF